MLESRKAAALGAAVVAALAVAVSALAGTNATSVGVTAGKPSEFKFTLSRKAGPKGAYVFTVTNRGKIAHDFLIAGKRTPLVKAGSRATLRVTIRKAGKYQFLCTVAGHAPAGMRGVFTVR